MTARLTQAWVRTWEVVSVLIAIALVPLGLVVVIVQAAFSGPNR
jgi:hypothetical protein